MSFGSLSSEGQETKDIKSEHGLTDTSENDEIQNYEGFDSTATGDIRELARTMSHLSREQTNKTRGSEDLVHYLSHFSSVPGLEPYNEVEDTLNPDSDLFDARLWVKNLRKLHDSDVEYYKPSSLGVAYRDLRASGVAADSDYQSTVFNGVSKILADGFRYLQKDDPSRYFDILKSMDGIMRPGEVTVVLGRPGSGCSTLLKTIASHTYGFKIGNESKISYDGLTPKDIENQFRGDVVYSAETDIHFPHLTVGDTLEFAAKMRTPQNRGNIDRETYAKHMASVYMATYGLSHTRNTNVGDDFVRGVSGGERKRVSIAEVSLSGSNIQCWDNATRGLDSATALEFIRALKTSATILDATPLIAIYQCSQDAYDIFDNVVVLYEGYQIFFGKANEAKEYFVNMGWECPQRQTTADFLTSLTNPAERVPREGFENSVPYTAKEFETYWKNSPQYKKLVEDIEEYFQKTDGGNHGEEYHKAHVARQSNHISPKSSFTVSFFMQTRYVMGRNILRTKRNPSVAIQSIAGQAFIGITLGSMFYNLSATTDTLYYRCATLFSAVLFNAFSSILEIMSLFEARPIVEKHKQYALYRPSADALAGIITELPTKLVMSIAFNFLIYFLPNLRRDAGRFFFFWLMCCMCTLVMSHLFRSLGAISTSFPGAMTPATVLLLAMVIFAGFVLPTPSMLGWSRWINYINPVAYVFEALMANEYTDRDFDCSQFVPSGPSYEDTNSVHRICAATGSKAGLDVLHGDDYLSVSYEYYNSHKWRNFGITVGFIVFFLFVYITLTEFNKGSMQKGEVALFLKSSLKDQKKKSRKSTTTSKDIENSAIPDEKISQKDQLEANKETEAAENALPSSNDIFHWRDLTYQVKIKSEDLVGAAPGSHANQDYHEVWRNSSEYQDTQGELNKMERELVSLPRDESPEARKSYATPIWKQYLIVTKRVFEQNWRSPTYIYSKIFLVVSSALFNGFSFFKANKSQQGLQNQMFAVFMFLVPFNTLVQQILPGFVKQRDVYEVRESPSKTFSWFAFITAQITSEIPYQVLVGTIAFLCWYYPVGFYENSVPTNTVDGRAVTMWLYITAFYVYTSTMAHVCISFNELADNAANLAVNFFTMCLHFCGVLISPDAMPGFWVFMYRVSPLTYVIQGMMSTGLANNELQCSSTELLRFEPTSGNTCGEYMSDYIAQAGGYLMDSNATSECEYCTMNSTNDWLATFNAYYSERWRNWGIFLCYIAFNMILTVFLYWLARVPKGNREKKK
ncbi:unnamed protein product [Debaryomyces tyrocola]|nr:unnamed protein product [Debaryomyces tyrocola]